MEMNTDKFNVEIKNVRMTGSGRVVGDLWVKLAASETSTAGTTMIAAGSLPELYDMCNARGYELMNYAASKSAISTLDEYKQFQAARRF